MRKLMRSSWIKYILVFVLFTTIWASLAGAVSWNKVAEGSLAEQPGKLLVTANATFGITLGAIILVTIIIASVAVQSTGRS